MSFIDNLFKKSSKIVTPIKNWVFSKEEFKGEVKIEKKKFPADLKDADIHPVNFERLEKWYKDDSFVYGVVEKFVDFIIGPGFFVKSKDKRAEKIIEQFMQDNEFNTLLREWLRRALITGNGYLELSGNKDESIDEIKVLDSKNMYVERDIYGRIKVFYQWKSILKSPISFEPYEIAHFSINKIGDYAYGIGIIFPLTYALSKKAQLINDMSLLMKRKANAPYHVIMGDRDKDIVPTEGDIISFGEKLDWLNNKHEWVTNPYVEIKTLDFGQIGDKFSTPLELINDELFYGSQIPAVLMGKANIPEGLAKTQMEAFLFRIKSIQEEMEKVIETKIFKRVLLANGLNVHVEFEWGKPTEREKREEMDILVKILDQYKFGAISDHLKEQIEKRIIELNEFEEPPKTKEQDQKEPQPKVPPSDLERPTQPVPGKPLAKQPKEHLHEDYEKEMDLTLHEWVGFNYMVYLKHIKEFIQSDKFEEREYTSFKYIPGTDQRMWEEIVVNYSLMDNLHQNQIKKLKNVLIENFDKGSSMRRISNDILEKVKPSDLKVTIPATDKRKAHDKIIPSKIRAVQIARVETIRASNQGALKNYQNNGIDKVQWIAAIGDRTCPYCDSMNGVVLNLNEANERIPAHTSCRCSWAPVVE